MLCTCTCAHHIIYFHVHVCTTCVGHAQPLDRLDLYAYGWGDFFLDIIARRTDSFIPVKNIYEKVIPGLKRNVLSARISKLQVKSEALSEPYISAMKKLGLVVTGASHFVGIVDFIKICKYFHVQPPDNLTKFYAVNSEVNPDDVLRTFSSEKTENQALGLLPTGSLFPGSEVQPGNMQSGAEGSGGAVMVSSGQADARPDSRGTSSRNVDQSASPQTTEEGQTAFFLHVHVQFTHIEKQGNTTTIPGISCILRHKISCLSYSPFPVHVHVNV